MPHLFFDMPDKYGVALLTLNKSGKIVTEWWARGVDDVAARATFVRWVERGHAAFLTYNGSILAQGGAQPKLSFKLDSKTETRENG